MNIHAIITLLCLFGGSTSPQKLVLIRGPSGHLPSPDRHSTLVGTSVERDMSIKTHGMSYSTEYKIWQGIQQRCFNESCRGFKNYGGRGIKACDSWLSFDNFYRDMGPRPSADYSIDRMDNHGNYEKSNCRWATQKQQNRNQRSNKMLAHDGRDMCVAEWAEYLGIRPGVIYNRLWRGWPVGKALSVPVGRSNESYTKEADDGR